MKNIIKFDKVEIKLNSDDNDKNGINKLNNMLKEGWQPWGDPFLTTHTEFVQVLVKHAVEPYSDEQTKTGRFLGHRFT